MAASEALIKEKIANPNVKNYILSWYSNKKSFTPGKMTYGWHRENIFCHNFFYNNDSSNKKTVRLFVLQLFQHDQNVFYKNNTFRLHIPSNGT
jgi:hypothetical protein